jgi:hypothetical protein
MAPLKTAIAFQDRETCTHSPANAAKAHVTRSTLSHPSLVPEQISLRPERLAKYVIKVIDQVAVKSSQA